MPTSFEFKAVALTTVLVISSLVCAAQGTPANGDQSWTASTQSAPENANPTRTTESHTKIGNRVIDKKTVEVLGPDGQYQPYSQTETETIQENNTTRSIVRSYSPGPDGAEQLTQVTDDTKQRLSDGQARVVRMISSPDGEGKLQVVQREVANTKTTGPSSEQTQSTIYRADSNGSLVPTAQVKEEKKAGANGSVAVTKTTSAQDLSGTWQVAERTQQTETTDGQNRTTETVTLRPDYEGKLSVVSRNVTHDSQAGGENKQTVETYSPDVAGSARDGNLHLLTRTTTQQKKLPGGTTTERQIESQDPADRKVKVMATTSSNTVVSSSGKTGTTETSVRGLNGDFSVVSEETKQSTQIPFQVQTSPADQPK
jgi:hypothetical protein